MDRARLVHGLDCVQQQIEQHLIDLVRIVVNGWNVAVHLKLDHDALRNGLLAGEHDGVFHGGAYVAHAELRRFGTRRVQQFSQDAIDLKGLLFGVFDHRARYAVRRKVTADNLNHSRDPSQRIADFMGQSGCQFAQGCEVLGARHLGLVQALDFLATRLELLHHVVEVTAQVADFIGAIREADGNVHVSQAQARDLLLQFKHRAPDGDCQDHNHGNTDEKRPSGSNRNYDMPFSFGQRQRHQHEQQQPVQQHCRNRQYGLQDPIDVTLALDRSQSSLLVEDGAFGNEDWRCDGHVYYLLTAGAC